MKFRKFLAGFLALAMIVGILPTIAMAAGKAELSLEVYNYTLPDEYDSDSYFTEDSNPGTIGTTPIDLENNNLQQDQYVIVKFKVSNVEGLIGDLYSLKVMTWAFGYDFDCLQPLYGPGADISSNDDEAVMSEINDAASSVNKKSLPTRYNFKYSDSPGDDGKRYVILRVEDTSSTPIANQIKSGNIYLCALPFKVVAKNASTQLTIGNANTDCTAVVYKEKTGTTPSHQYAGDFEGFSREELVNNNLLDGTTIAPVTVNIGTPPEPDPVATDWDGDTKAAIAAAIKDKTAENQLDADGIKALLPTSGNVVDANGGSYSVTMTWATTDEYNAKGKDYTYTPTLSTSAAVDVSGFGSTHKETVSIAPVNLDLNQTFKDADTVVEGTSNAKHKNLKLPVSGSAKAGTATFPYIVEWTPASTALTTTAGQSQTFTGTIKWVKSAEDKTEVTLPTWVTVPSSVKLSGIETKISVTAKPKATAWTTAANTAQAAVTMDANDDRNATEAALKAILPAKLKATLNDTDSTEVELATTNWTYASGEGLKTAWDAKGGKYTFEATPTTDSDTFTIDSNLKASVTVTVNPVTVTNPTLDPVVKSVGSVDNTSYTTLGLKESDTVKDSKNNDVSYTINWTSPAANTVQTNTPNDVTFTGTISYPSAPAWLTLPTSTTVTQTVSVKALPQATDFTAASKTAIAALSKHVTASANTLTIDALKTAASLPTEAKVTVGTGTEAVEKDVKLTWDNPTGTYDPKTGEYKFTATIEPKDSPATFTIPSSLKAEATIAVDAVTASYPANVFDDLTPVIGTYADAEALGAHMGGKLVVSGQESEYAYTVTWDAKTLNTEQVGASQTFNGTAAFTNAPTWLTTPATAVTQKVTMQAKPAATDWTAASKTAIQGLTQSIKASAGTIDAATLKTTANLPATATVVVGNGEKTVNLTWDNLDATSYDPKKGTYTFTATAIEPADNTFTVPSSITASAVVTVEAVTVALPTLNDVPKTLGNVDNTSHTTLGLTTSGNATDDNSGTHAFTIAWTEAADTAKDEVGDYTFNGTVTYTNAPAWLTQPTSLAVTQKVVVTDPKEKATDLAQASKDAIKAVEDAAPILASSADNTAAALAAKLPTDLKVVDAAGNEYDVTAAWELDDASYDKKGGDHKYKATLTSKNGDVDVSELSAPTATIKVDPVKVTVPTTLIFAADTVSRGTANTSFATLGLTETGKATLTPAVEGTEVNYTIAWTPASTSFDTSVSGNSATFQGTITLTDVKDWMTVPTADELKGSKTLTVRSSGGGGGGGGGSRATATPKASPTASPEATATPGAHTSGNYIVPISEYDKSEVNGKTIYEVSKELIDKAVEPAKDENNSRAIIVGAADKSADYEYINIPAQDIKDALKQGVDFELRTGSGLSVILPTTVADDITDDTEFVEVRIDKNNDEYTIGLSSNDEALKNDNRLIAKMEGLNHLDCYVPVIDGAPVKMSIPDGNGVKFLLTDEDYTFENRHEPFDDVDESFWGEQFIDFLYARDMVTGVGDNMFEPHSDVTRAQFARMIVEAFGLEGGSAEDLAQFTDIEDGAWYVESLRTAAKAGVIRGYEDETIRPYSPITREEMTAMLARACDNAGMSFSGTPVTFDDEADIADYAKANVAALTSGGIINGMGDGTFAPKNTTTRAEAATVITKVFKQIVEDFLK